MTQRRTVVIETWFSPRSGASRVTGPVADLHERAGLDPFLRASLFEPEYGINPTGAAREEADHAAAGGWWNLRGRAASM
jgi:hypothetical protein